MPTDGDDSGTTAERSDLDKLAAELISRGFQARVAADLLRGTYLHVRNPRADLMSERIQAKGEFFTWSWGEPVARRDQVPTAAGCISRVLRALCPEPAE